MLNSSIILTLFALVGLSQGNFISRGGNIVEDNARRVGTWGGSCTCPDGSVYQVGDNHDACGSLACIGGVSGACNRRSGIWSRRKVTCAGASPVEVDLDDPAIDMPVKEGEWHSANFVAEQTGETGTLRRFKGVIQDSGHFTLSNIAIIDFDGDAENMLFGKLTLFPKEPSMLQKTFSLIMDCKGNNCEADIPFGKTIDACDIATIVSATGGSVGLSGKLVSYGLKPFLGAGFASKAGAFVYYAMQAKYFMNDKVRMGDSSDLGGGCEDMANFGVSILKYVTKGESERLFNLGSAVSGIIDMLDNSLGQLTFGVDINIRGRVLNERQLARTSPFDVAVTHLHVVVDNGDQCTGNILCASMVALGEAFPGTTGHKNSVLGCTKFKFVFPLDREDWRNGNGVTYTCENHEDFEGIRQNILDRAENVWKTIKNAPGIRDYGKHNSLCFHNNHCKQRGDGCVAGLCRRKSGEDEICLHDGDCAKNNCLVFQCTEGREGSRCNTNDDCESDRCNLLEVPFRCRKKKGYNAVCAKDSDCASGDCLFHRCIDGRDGGLCNTDDDCDSRRCDLRKFRCERKAGWGAFCLKDGDCASGDCLFGKCIDGRLNDLCNTNDDCDSGRCALPQFRCQNRLRKGSWCRANNDCQSRSCSWWWKCN